MSINNMDRLGTRNSTNVNPRGILPDIDKNIRRLERNRTPLQTLGNFLGRGKKPEGLKVEVMQYDAYDNYATCTLGELGTAGNSETRMARLTVDLQSHLTDVLYTPGTKLFIMATGQTVEVVMTATDRATTKTGALAVTAALTNNTTTATNAGDVIVRNVEPYALRTFSTSDIIDLGNAQHETQTIDGDGRLTNIRYDYNWVELKDDVIKVTERNLRLIKETGEPSWTRDQREQIVRFKQQVEYNAFFSERSVDYEYASPKYHMRGLYNVIQTNRASYNPDSTVDFEYMIANFLDEQGFNYGPKKKILFAGPKFTFNFNMAFREYRRTDLDGAAKKVGIDIATYFIPGGYEIKIITNEIFKRGTPASHWAMVVDPAEAEWRISMDYTTRWVHLANERVKKLAVEWEGSIAWHREEHHALLVTH